MVRYPMPPSSFTTRDGIPRISCQHKAHTPSLPSSGHYRTWSCLQKASTQSPPSVFSMYRKHQHKDPPSVLNVITELQHEGLPSVFSVYRKHQHKDPPSVLNVITELQHKGLPSVFSVYRKHQHKDLPSVLSVITEPQHKAPPSVLAATENITTHTLHPFPYVPSQNFNTKAMTLVTGLFQLPLGNIPPPPPPTFCLQLLAIYIAACANMHSVLSRCSIGQRVYSPGLQCTEHALSAAQM